jgi:hypothetical protein
VNRSRRPLELTGWPHRFHIDMVCLDMLHSEAPRCLDEPLVSIGTPMPDTTHLGVCILDQPRDFVTRTPAYQWKFDEGMLFWFDIHWRFSIVALSNRPESLVL